MRHVGGDDQYGRHSVCRFRPLRFVYRCRGHYRIHRLPGRHGDRNARKAGRHALGTGDLKSPIENPRIRGAPTSTRPGQFAPAAPGGMVAGSRVTDSSATAGYWALIVGDEATTAAQVQTRLLPMSRDGTVDDILERLGPVLMDGRARLWAAYFAPVAR